MLEEYQVKIDIERELKDLEKYANFFFLMHFWMESIEKGKTVGSFFSARGYKKIAVYGIGYLGKHLITQLSDSEEVVYTIDQGMVSYQGNSYSLPEASEILSMVDVIVITPISDYPVIKKSIKNICDIEVVSLEEVILSL